MTHILQLAPNLELLSDGDAQRNTLFALGRGLAPPLGEGDQLLLVDPPDDVRARFTLPERVVAVSTLGGTPAGLATVAAQVGGVAHMRIGEHLVDLHTFDGRAVVHLPALGLLCGGGFGLQTQPPRLQQRGSGQGVNEQDEIGAGELAVLRFLARTVRERRIQLYLPLYGAPEREIMRMMSALADDVGYIHSLRRNVSAIVRSGDGLNAALAVTETVLPPHWSNPQAKAVHAANVNTLYADTIHQQN